MFRSGGSAILAASSRRWTPAASPPTCSPTPIRPPPMRMAKKGFFVAFKPKNFDKIPDAAKAADGIFVGQRLNMMTHYVRSDKVAAADEPKTWNDLLDAKYKGKLVMTDPSFTSLQVSVVGMMSKERGWGFYEKLRANDVMIVQGNQQVVRHAQARRAADRGRRAQFLRGRPQDAKAIRSRRSIRRDGVFVIPSPTSVVKGSPNPNAAKLFAEFMIGDDAQKIFPADGGYSARLDIAAPAGSPDLKTSRSSRWTTTTSRRKPSASSAGSTRFSQ